MKKKSISTQESEKETGTVPTPLAQQESDKGTGTVPTPLAQVATLEKKPVKEPGTGTPPTQL